MRFSLLSLTTSALSRAAQLAAGGLLLALPLRAQTQVHVADKLAPGVATQARHPAATVAVRVQVRDAAAFRQWAAQQTPALRVLPAAGAARILTLERVSAPQLAALAASPLVEFVDVPN
ncbi:MAG: hypothetical protein EOO56_09655, partial [Hymenobacter sp.]